MLCMIWKLIIFYIQLVRKVTAINVTYFSVFIQTFTSIHWRDSQGFLVSSLLGIINFTPAQVNIDGTTQLLLVGTIYPILWTVVGLWIISAFTISKDAAVRIFVRVTFIYFSLWIADIPNCFKGFIYHFYFTCVSDLPSCMYAKHICTMIVEAKRG